MKKETRTLLIAEVVYTLLLLTLIAVVTCFLQDEWFYFKIVFLVLGVICIPLFLAGQCTIYTVWAYSKKHIKNHVLSLAITILYIIFIAYLLFIEVLQKYIEPWYWIVWCVMSVLIIVLCLVNFIKIFIKIKKAKPKDMSASRQ